MLFLLERDKKDEYFQNATAKPTSNKGKIKIILWNTLIY